MTKMTYAFYLQSAVSFGAAMLFMLGGIYFIPADPWVRAFLGLGALFLINSSFALAKCVRDNQEERAAEGHVAPYR